MKYFLLLSIAVFFVACKSPEKMLTHQTSTDIVTEVAISENQIHFQIKNISNESVFLYNQKKLNIQRFDNNEWNNVQILSCPCGAPCAKPSEKIEILKGQSHSFNWDKQESWCGKKNEHGIPETIKIISTPGKYRIMIIYQINQAEKQTLYKEFEL